MGFFDFDLKALIFSLVGLLVFALLKKRFLDSRLTSHLVFSSQSFCHAGTRSWRQKCVKMPRLFAVLSLIFFLAALINPHFFLKKEDLHAGSNAPSLPVEGVAMFLILDQSGSMEQKTKAASISGKKIETKMDLLKDVTEAFIQGNAKLGLKGRPNDMIGLVAFARTAQVLSPLTLDHKAILNQLQKLDVMKIKDQDGTGIGYAIYKTAHLIAATRNFARSLAKPGKPAYEIKDSVMILVTDGMQDPNPLDEGNRFRWMDPEAAADFAKSERIRLYVINIDPEFTKPEWAANRQQIERITQLTGGHFYSLNRSSDIADIYKKIDQLEKSALPPAKEKRDEEKHLGDTTLWLYPYLISFGLAFMFLSLILQTVWLRTIP